VSVEDRARAAGRDVQEAARAGAATRGAAIDRFERYRRRTQRNQRIGVALLTTALAIAVVILMTRAFPGAERQLPAGSPHNGRIAYGLAAHGVDGIRLFTAEPDGTNAVGLPEVTQCAAWSPDGSKMQVTGSEYPGAPLRPAIIDPDGSNFRLLNVSAPPRLNLGCGDWSPDGTRLALEGFSDVPQLNGLYTVRASDGGDLTQVSTVAGGNPEYSPDGTRIVSIGSDPTRDLKPSAGALFVVNTDGGGLRRITPWGLAQRSGGSWSPDGRWILFQRTGGGLLVVHPDGTDLHEIAVEGIPPGAHAIEPHWSPDGAMIVFGLSVNEQEDIYTVRSDGTDLVQITDTPNVEERRPAWGTNGG
jgi:TolB protein